MNAEITLLFYVPTWSFASLQLKSNNGSKDRWDRWCRILNVATEARLPAGRQGIFKEPDIHEIPCLRGI